MIPEAKSIAAVFLFRNWPTTPFELCLHSMDLQTRKFDEVILIDLASDESFAAPMEELCKQWKVDYHYLAVDASPRIIDLYLWNTAINFGIRKAKSDLILKCGVDRLYERNTVQHLLDAYNRLQKRNMDSMLAAGVRNLYRFPDPSELKDFRKLLHEATWRGGYAYECASRCWFHKVRGYDESLRWYEDLDISIRAKVDKLAFIWISRGELTPERDEQECRVIHLAKHPKSRKAYGDWDVIEIARRGKRFIHKNRYNRNIIRNDETWGQITEEKIERAKLKSNWTSDDCAKSLALWIEDYEKWYKVHGWGGFLSV